MTTIPIYHKLIKLLKPAYRENLRSHKELAIFASNLYSEAGDDYMTDCYNYSEAGDDYMTDCYNYLKDCLDNDKQITIEAVTKINSKYNLETPKIYIPIHEEVKNTMERVAAEMRNNK